MLGVPAAAGRVWAVSAFSFPVGHTWGIRRTVKLTHSALRHDGARDVNAAPRVKTERGAQKGLAIRNGRAVAKIELAITRQPATNMIVLVNIETLPLTNHPFGIRPDVPNAGVVPRASLARWFTDPTRGARRS